MTTGGSTSGKWMAASSSALPQNSRRANSQATATSKNSATARYLAFLRTAAAKTIFEKYGFSFLIRPVS